MYKTSISKCHHSYFKERNEIFAHLLYKDLNSDLYLDHNSSWKHLAALDAKITKRVRFSLWVRPSYIIGGKKSNSKQRAQVSTKPDTSIKKSMSLKDTSKAKLLCGRISFEYGFICEGFKQLFTMFSILMITQCVKCFEVMRSLLKLLVSFKINWTKYFYTYSISSPWKSLSEDVVQKRRGKTKQKSNKKQCYLIFFH